MGEIQLYQRSQLPPGQVGLAKPPYALAERPVGKSGFISAGQAIAGFSGDIFQKLMEVRANNEHHEFLGQIKTAQQEFENFVQTNPGAPFEKLQEAKTKMLTDIDKAGQNSQTQIAKRANKNFMLLNRETIEKQADGVIAEIGAKFEADRTQILVEDAVKRNDKPTMESLIDSQAGTIIPKELAEAYKQHYGAIIDRNLAKQAEDNAVATMESFVVDMAAEKGYDETIKWVSDPKNISEMMTKLGVSFKDIDALTENLTTQLDISKKAADKILEKTKEKANLDIFNAIQKNDPNAVNMINDPNSPLDVSERKDWLDYSKKGENFENDWGTYDRIQTMIDGVRDGTETSEKVKKEISAAVNKKIDFTNAEQLRNKLSTVNKPDDLVGQNKDYFAAIDEFEKLDAFMPSDEKLEATYGKYTEEQKPALQKLYAVQVKIKKRNELEEWFKSHPDATPQQKQDKLKELLAPAKQEMAKGFLKKAVSTFLKLNLGASVWYLPSELREAKQAIETFRNKPAETAPETTPGFFNVEPQTQEEFEDKVANLKTMDMAIAKNYYDKWAGKWQ